MEIHLFQNDALSADYYNLCLDEKEITKILKHLNSVIPTVKLLNENDNDGNKEEVEKRDECCVVSVKYDDYNKEFYNRKNAPYPIDMMEEAIKDDR